MAESDLSRPEHDLLAELNRLEALRDDSAAQEQRRSRRYVARGDAELLAMGPAGVSRSPVPVSVRDIGRFGLGFIAREALPVGSAWRAGFLEQGYLVAQQPLVVRHCRHVRDDLHLIGGEFCAETGLLILMGVSPSEIDHEDDNGGTFLSPADLER